MSKSAHLGLLFVSLGVFAAACFVDSAGEGGDDGDDSSTGMPVATSAATTAAVDTTANPADDTDDDTDDGTAGDETGPAVTCPEGQSCVTAGLPPDWNGPFAVIDGPDADAPCPPGWSAQMPLFNDLDSSTLSCSCSCATGTEADCTFGLVEYASPDCEASSGAPAPMAELDCLALTKGANSFQLQPGTATGGVCPEGVGDVVRAAAPTWERAVVGCRPPGMPSVCDDGVCLAAPPPPLLPGFCIERAGMHACENLGPFTERIVLFESFQDQRDCPPECPCEAGRDVACSATATLHANSGNCNPGESVPVAVGDCDFPNGASSVQLASVTAEVPCEPLQASIEPAGQITPIGAHTVCCAPA